MSRKLTRGGHGSSHCLPTRRVHSIDQPRHNNRRQRAHVAVFASAIPGMAGSISLVQSAAKTMPAPDIIDLGRPIRGANCDAAERPTPSAGPITGSATWRRRSSSWSAPASSSPRTRPSTITSGMPWRVGRVLEARFQWSHARDLKPEPEDLVKIEAKLKSGLPDNTAPAAEHKKPDGG